MNILNRLACAVLGHRIATHQVFTTETRRVICDCCGGDYAMNDRERILTPWNGEFAKFYEDMGHTIKPISRAAP